MQDRVPLYPGRVKLTPVSGQENVYDMVRADQPTQAGDPLNKDTLLKDATAALFGLGTDAVPDDMINALAHTGDLHVWKRTHDSTVDYPVHPNKNGYQEGSDKKPAWYTLENEAEVSKLYFEGGFIYVSDNVELNDDGSIFPNGENVSASEVKDKAKGKYVYNSKENITMYFVPSDAVITNGYDSRSYISINKAQKVIGYPAIPATTEIEYIGQLGDRARVVVGSYVGDGSNQWRNIDVGFKPIALLLSVMGKLGDSVVPTGLIVNRNTDLGDKEFEKTFELTETGFRVKVYSSSSGFQVNVENTPYDYIAIG